MTKQGSVTRRASVALLATMATGTALSQGFPPQAAPGIKKALCVGNSRYVTRPLKNPVNDARSVGSALRDLGFEVTLVLDSTLTEMREAFRVFFEQSKDAETAFIFYAGHGFEVNGTNYLIPSDANPSTITSSDIAQVGFSMRTLTAELERSRAKVRVVVIDACRDTPKRGPTLGMQQMTAKGTLLAFSTSPGYLAEDSIAGIKTGNSPYTFALTESLRNRDLTLKEMFNRAHTTVAALTQERQIPWVHDGMTGDVRLYDSKIIVNSAAINSNLLSTNNRSTSRGANQDQLPDVLSPREAREKLLLLGYRGTDRDIAEAILKSVDVESADLCVAAGIKLQFTRDPFQFIVNKNLIKTDLDRTIKILPKIVASGVNVDKLTLVGIRESSIEDSIQAQAVMRNTGKPFSDYDSAYFELTLLSYAVWVKQYDLVKVLLDLGASKKSDISIVYQDRSGPPYLFEEKRILVSNSGRELALANIRIKG